MPVKDCMTGSAYCPANQESKFAIPGYESKGCDECVNESLQKNEIPKCFFCKVDEDEPFDVIDYTVDAFAKKVTDIRKRLHK